MSFYSGTKNSLHGFFLYLKEWLYKHFKSTKQSCIHIIDESSNTGYIPILSLQASTYQYISGTFLVQCSHSGHSNNFILYINNSYDIFVSALYPGTFGEDFSSLKCAKKSTYDENFFNLYIFRGEKNSGFTENWNITPISIISWRDSTTSKDFKSDVNSDLFTYYNKKGTFLELSESEIPEGYVEFSIQQKQRIADRALTADSSTSSNSAPRATQRIDGAVAYCSTAAGTAAKVASCDNFKLKKGIQVFVRFTAANTASNATLNVNSTGAKPLFVNGARATTSNLEAGTYLFTYDGTNWRCLIGKTPIVMEGTTLKLYY